MHGPRRLTKRGNLGMYMFFICIMWGFDGLAGGVVTSIAEFRKDFGYPYAGDYVVDANWQLGWLAATLFGTFHRT
jgi:hypothetical protein